MKELWTAVIYVLTLIYISFPVWMKRRIIKRRHKNQMLRIQTRNPNNLILLPFNSIEGYYSVALCLATCGFIFHSIFLRFPRQIYRGKISMEVFGMILLAFLIYTLVFFLLDLGVFYLRKKTGHIPGAVVFDKDEKKFYAFPTYNSEWDNRDYDVYHESELIYTREKNGFEDFKSYGYYFYTQKDEKFVFTTGDLTKNHFDEKLTLPESREMSVPFWYHSSIYILTFLGLGVGGAIFYWMYTSLT